MTCPACGSPNEPGRKFCGECGTRLAAVCPSCGTANTPVRALLRRVRHGARPGRHERGGGRQPCPSAPRPVATPNAAPDRRAAARDRPVRRPRRLHDARRGPRRRGRPRAAVELLRARVRDDPAATAARSRSSSATPSWRCGARRPRTRTTPSARCGPALELVDVGHARWAPRDPGALRRPDGRGRGHARRDGPGHGRGRPRQHRVAGSSPSRRRAPCSSASRPTRASSGAIAYEAAGEQVAQGQGGAGRGVAGAAGRRGARRRAAGRAARGAVRRARRRSCGCSRTCSTRRRASSGSRLVSITGQAGHRQEPPRMGVPQVRRRRGRAGLVARRAARPRTARGSRSGRWARWSAAGPGSPRATTRRRPAPRIAEVARRERARRGRATADRAGAARAARGRARRRRAARRSCSRPGGRSSSGSPARRRRRSVRGPALGGPGPARLHRAPARVEPRRPDPDRHARPPGAPRDAARLGRGQALLPRPRPPAARRGGDARPARGPRARACPRRRSRSIVARAEGIPLYAVETVRMLVADGRLAPREDGGYEPAGELGELAVPATLHALIAARLDALEARRSGAAPGRAPCSARRSRPTRSPRCRATGGRAGAAPRALVAARSAARRDRPAVPGARPVRVRAGPHPRGRLLDARLRDRRRAHLAAARYFESTRRRRAGGRARRRTTSPPTGRRPRAPRRRRSRRRRGSRCGPRPTRAGARVAGPGGRPTSSRRAMSRWTTRDRADMLEQAGRAAMRSSRADLAIELLTNAVAAARRAVTTRVPSRWPSPCWPMRTQPVGVAMRASRWSRRAWRDSATSATTHGTSGCSLSRQGLGLERRVRLSRSDRGRRSPRAERLGLAERGRGDAGHHRAGGAVPGPALGVARDAPGEHGDRRAGGTRGPRDPLGVDACQHHRARRPIGGRRRPARDHHDRARDWAAVALEINTIATSPRMPVGPATGTGRR